MMGEYPEAIANVYRHLPLPLRCRGRRRKERGFFYHYEVSLRKGLRTIGVQIRYPVPNICVVTSHVSESKF